MTIAVSRSSKLEMARRNRRRVEQFTRQLKSAIAKWLAGYGRRLVEDEIKALRITGTGKARKIKLAKAASYTDEDLLRILRMFGLRHVDQEGQAIANTLGGTWEIPPDLVAAIIRDKQIQVRNITRGSAKAVHDKIREILLKAEQAKVQPTYAEVARRIRTECADLHEFSPGRAGLIARTEAVQNQNTGIYKGMEEAGVEVVEWLASSNPNHGERRHDLMNGQRVKLGEKFVNPTTGEELQHPGDMSAPISETANCGCVLVMARVVEPKAKRKR